MDKFSKVKDLRFQSVLSALLFVICGVLLAVNPVKTTRTICYTIGFIIIMIAIVNLIKYYNNDYKNNVNKHNFVKGIMILCVGLFFIIGYRIIVSIIPAILGTMILISGIMKFVNAYSAIKVNNTKSTWMLIISVINVLLGIFIVTNTFRTSMILLRIIGICIIFSGVSDLISLIYIEKKMRDYKKDMDALNQ